MDDDDVVDVEAHSSMAKCLHRIKYLHMFTFTYNSQISEGSEFY
jgi:hypothetical protein